MKLIRDRLADPTLWEWFKQGAEYVRPVKDRHEHETLLGRKLLEEAGELLAAADPAETVAEVADVVAVLKAIVVVAGGRWADVEAVEVAKRAAKGGFEEGTVWDV